MDRSQSKGAKRVQADEFITEHHFDNMLRLERAYVDTIVHKIEVANDKRMREMTSSLRSEITDKLLQRILVGENSMSKKIEAFEDSMFKKLEKSHQQHTKFTNDACRRLGGKLCDIQSTNTWSQEQQMTQIEMSIAKLQTDMDALRADVLTQEPRFAETSPTPKMPGIVSALQLEVQSQLFSLCSRVTALETLEQVAHSSSADEASVYEVPVAKDCAQCLDNSDASTAVSVTPLRSSVEAIQEEMQTLEHKATAEMLDRQTACATLTGSGMDVQNLEQRGLSWREKPPVAALSFLEPRGESSETALASPEPGEACPPPGAVETAVIACASPSRPSRRGRQGHQMSTSPTKTPLSLKTPMSNSPTKRPMSNSPIKTSKCFPKEEQEPEEIEEFLKGLALEKAAP